MGQISAALAAGNPVLAKPAEQTPLIAAQAVRILHEAGVPIGVVQLLPGAGETVGAALVADERVSGVMFTGSTEVARLIARTLATRLDGYGKPMPLIAETGGQNAMIVDSSALAEQVVADVLVSAFDSAGQRCSALRVLCVQEEVAERILTMLKGAMQELRIGNPAYLATDVGPVIDTAAKATLENHIETMRAKGHKVFQPRLLDASATRGFANGTFVLPTLIEIEAINELKHEVFGPVLHIIRYRRPALESLLKAINRTGYGLTLGLHTRIDETITYVSEAPRNGSLVETATTRAAVARLTAYRDWLTTQNDTLTALRCERYLKHIIVGSTFILPGPTGEENTYSLKCRGTIRCEAATLSGARAQLAAALATGNHALFASGSAHHPADPSHNPPEMAWVQTLPAILEHHVSVERSREDPFDAVLFEGERALLQPLVKRIAARPGPLIGIQSVATGALASNEDDYILEQLLSESSVSLNTAAAGGNASLLMIT
ncbi:hypothetical protein BGZ96_008330 [Linnemannia gamsii]|uniref:L-glutamate gamma-semialdehyde dehydrogenase n=1 Tax=Linnemannia gamsii TaxID=64522 RepID=A0ABQ7KF23_9FUNG|nr:hypothetical protein BGZ96_008330 [Linnemannia gamsii]